VAHGPKPRDYRQRTPKKMIRLALRSALSDRAAEGKILVLDDWGITEPRTKAALELLGDERLRQKFGAANRARVDRLFRWERAAAEVKRIYEEVLDGWRRRRAQAR